MNAPTLEQMKNQARSMWAAGDFPAVAKRQLWPVGERIVRRMEIRPGEDVLDIACGTGNAALRAAAAGGRTVAVDLTPELLEVGRALAGEARVSIDWREGDAEALPVKDASFDVVLSVFGCMFAPRHQVTAREIARALKPNGRFGLCNWTPEGASGKFFRAIGAYMPAPPPDLAQPPLLWGSENHVRELFKDTGVKLEFARETVEFQPFRTVDEEIEFATTKFGPLILAKPMLEAQGKWTALLDDMRKLMEKREPAEYLVVVGRK
jgi:SAM-dependent methyltransferase